MSEKHIERKLASAEKSMEIEGFKIDRNLRNKGLRILRGETTADALIGQYIQSLKSKQSRT
jgi:hypothetical protein